jgi:hypothetical protein
VKVLDLECIECGTRSVHSKQHKFHYRFFCVGTLSLIAFELFCKVGLERVATFRFSEAIRTHFLVKSTVDRWSTLELVVYEVKGSIATSSVAAG